MARKKTANGRLSPLPPDEKAVDAASSSTAPSTPRIDIVAASARVQRDVIKVNNVNLSDLKNSCDDVVKRVRRACFKWHLCVDDCRLPVIVTARVISAKSYAHRCKAWAGLG